MQFRLSYSNTVSIYVPGGLIRMAFVRTVLMACLLAVLSIDRTAAQSEVHAFIGENVILPCLCSNKMERVVWQDGNTVVNHYRRAEEKSDEPDPSYKNRSLFLSEGIKEGQCSLLLHQVSASDEKNYTCYIIYESTVNESHVYLKISQQLKATPTPKPRTTTVAASLSLVAIMVIILAFIIIGILLKRRRHQRTLQKNHLDPQSGLPILNHSPV